MASPQQTDDPSPGHGADHHGNSPPPVLRLRLVPWDVTCAVAGLATLLILGTATDWHSRLFGFLNDVCTGDDCAPAPYGVDFYIYPVVWGGFGAAIAAALIGPVISLLKGWYLSFWPLLAFGIVVVSSVAGSALTAFCEPYWHMTG
jgi:hypothetical protein